MLKKTISYEDYDGNQRTEDFYFNLSKAEVIDWLTTSGRYTLDKLMDKLVRTENTKEIMQIFKDLIYRSYGEKSLDGRRFIKTEEVKNNFIETEAYSSLYMELIGDAKKAADFITGIVPKDLGEDVKTVMNDPSRMNELPESVKPYAQQVAASTPGNGTVVDMPAAQPGSIQ